MQSLPLIFVAFAAAGLGSGVRLPQLRGEFLTGQKAELPRMAEGKVALLVLGFTYDSRFAVEAWVKRFRQDYGSNDRVTFYEIPMIGGMARLGKWFIDAGMRKGTPQADHSHVITVYGGTGPWKERLNYSDPDAAYLILLDPEGNVTWTHGGKFDESEYKNLSGAVSQALAR